MNMEIKKSIWRRGKDATKAFYKVKLSKKTNFITFFMGILLTAILIVPFACLLFEIVELYWYNEKTMVIFLAFAWGLLMICNGLSNFFTVKMCKAIETDMDDLQKINEYEILFYQTLNPGFGLFMFFVLMFFGVSAV